MNNELLEPSITEDHEPIKSYNINYLFYAAFFGGLIPTMGLCSKNASWLHIKKKTIHILIAAGIILLLVKLLLMGYFLSGVEGSNFGEMLRERKRMMRIPAKIMAAVLYLGYYLVMKNAFKRHIATGGVPTPLLSDALVWTIAGGLFENLIIFGGGILVSNIF